MDKTLGGTCVNVGCIPSKALLTSSEHFEFMRSTPRRARHRTSAQLTLDLATMLKRKDDVVGQNTKGHRVPVPEEQDHVGEGARDAAGGERRRGRAESARGPPREKIATYQAKNVIIATGSVPIELPFLKFDEERVLSNVGALKIPHVPKHLIVIGGGVIGLELGSVWRRLGAKVTVVELLPTILPGMDDDVVKEADKVLRKQGLDIRTGTKVVNGGRTETRRLHRGREGRQDASASKATTSSSPSDAGPSTSGIDAEALGLDRRQARRDPRRRPDAHQPAERVRHRRLRARARCSRTRPRKRASSPPK